MASLSYTDIGSTPCLPGRNIKVSNAHVCDELSIPHIVDLVDINGSPYPPANPVVPLPLIARKILRTNDTATAVLWGDVPQGTDRQVLQTKSDATGVNWTTNLSVPGTLSTDSSLTVTGSSTLTGPVNVVDDLQMNGISGVTDTVLQKTSAATQSWVLPSQVRCIRYATYFLAQDLNSGVGPTPVTFDNGGGIANISRTSRGVAPGINQTSTTDFTVGFTGLYDIDICGFIDPTSTGLVSTVVSLSLEIATVESTQSCVVVNTFAFTGKFSSIPLLAGQVVRILARRIANTGTMNTIASGGLAPNFSSTIDFTLVSIV